ncbi:MAG: S-methyl-5-thioribose-1-phosphate isomerase, partial [Alphaproteobacteria bacterium]
MKIDGTAYRTIWVNADGWSVDIIDQTRLPHALVTVTLSSLEDAAEAIGTMLVRGAPLIGATAAYGLALAMRADPSDSALAAAHARLLATRPTAVNLRWALDDLSAVLANTPPERRVAAAYRRAAELCDEDVAMNSAIGDHGLPLIQRIAKDKAARGSEGPVNVLTHC